MLIIISGIIKNILSILHENNGYKTGIFAAKLEKIEKQGQNEIT